MTAQVLMQHVYWVWFTITNYCGTYIRSSPLLLRHSTWSLFGVAPQSTFPVCCLMFHSVFIVFCPSNGAATSLHVWETFFFLLLPSFIDSLLPLTSTPTGLPCSNCMAYWLSWRQQKKQKHYHWSTYTCNHRLHNGNVHLHTWVLLAKVFIK